MMSYRHKAFRIFRKRGLFFISAEDLQINWNWLYTRSPYIFGGILSLGLVSFILWLAF